MGNHLQKSPVSDEVRLQSQDKLTDSKGNVDTYTRHHAVLVAHVLHYQHEADHEARHPSHPRDEPQYGEHDKARWPVAMRCWESWERDE